MIVLLVIPSDPKIIDSTYIDTTIETDSDTTKEIISFADEYTHTAEHIENVLGIESYNADETEVKDTDEQNENKDEVSQNKNQNETTSTKTENPAKLNASEETVLPSLSISITQDKANLSSFGFNEHIPFDNL